MTFTESQKNIIKETFLNDKYKIVYKASTPYKSTWSIAFEPDWNWEIHDFRILMHVDHPMSGYEVDDLYVYVYDNTITYNEPSKVTKIYHINGVDADGSLTTTATMSKGFRTRGNLTIGDELAMGLGLDIFGNTEVNLSSTGDKIVGPHIKLSTGTDSNSYVKLVYSDIDTFDVETLDSEKISTLHVVSKNGNELLDLNGLDVDVELDVNGDLKTSLLSIRDSTVCNSVHTTNMTLTPSEVGRYWYPIGSIFWSSVDVNPATYFGGTWIRIINTFLYCMDHNEIELRDLEATTYTKGEYAHTLTTAELGKHTHKIINTKHNHTLIDYGHAHFVLDPGHTHAVRTIGDNYVNKTVGTPGNFTCDGTSDMTNANYTLGLKAVLAYPTIPLTGDRMMLDKGNNVIKTDLDKNILYSSCNYAEINRNVHKSNFEIQTFKDSNPHNAVSTPGQNNHNQLAVYNNPTAMLAHNNMPPYIHAFCWRRTK